MLADSGNGGGKEVEERVVVEGEGGRERSSSTGGDLSSLHGISSLGVSDYGKKIIKLKWIYLVCGKISRQRFTRCWYKHYKMKSFTFIKLNSN